MTHPHVTCPEKKTDPICDVSPGFPAMAAGVAPCAARTACIPAKKQHLPNRPVHQDSTASFTLQKPKHNERKSIGTAVCIRAARSAL